MVGISRIRFLLFLGIVVLVSGCATAIKLVPDDNALKTVTFQLEKSQLLSQSSRLSIEHVKYVDAVGTFGAGYRGHCSRGNSERNVDYGLSALVPQVIQQLESAHRFMVRHPGSYSLTVSVIDIANFDSPEIGRAQANVCVALQGMLVDDGGGVLRSGVYESGYQRGERFPVPWLPGPHVKRVYAEHFLRVTYQAFLVAFDRMIVDMEPYSENRPAD